MSQELNRYGAKPPQAEIMRQRAIDSQTFYEAKPIFPRGDATTIMFDFDVAGKITGIGVMSLAGD